jgi:hypothetical protein
MFENTTKMFAFAFFIYSTILIVPTLPYLPFPILSFIYDIYYLLRLSLLCGPDKSLFDDW